eukprot:m.109044 g.109044  ORF g.109044 m.109044 type:complete len:102 (+) comp13362_c0_seq1:2298-2603(+)
MDHTICGLFCLCLQKVTRWRSDPHARGSYSFISTHATGNDYDILQKPVQYSEVSHPSIYFAGEHTNRMYPASAHGALLSGYWAANQLYADAFHNPSTPQSP